MSSLKNPFCRVTFDGRNPANQLICSLSHYLQGFVHPRWCRISEPSTVWTGKRLVFGSASVVHIWAEKNCCTKLPCTKHGCCWQWLYQSTANGAIPTKIVNVSSMSLGWKNSQFGNMIKMARSIHSWATFFDCICMKHKQSVIMIIT